MKKVYILIGLPGCGKTTWSDNKLKKSKFPNPPTAVVSSDAIRGELYGDENVQGDPNVVFDTVKQRLADAVCGYYDNIILDATNLKKKDRIKIIKDLKHRVRHSSKKTRDIEYEVIAVWFAVPVDECQKRNSERKRVVPKEVIDRMYKNFCPPSFMEGFDRIKIVMSDYDTDKYSLDNFLKIADAFEQHNPHHTLTLGGHCRKAQKYVDEKGCGNALSFAA
jgi:predicted kinase